MPIGFILYLPVQRVAYEWVWVGNFSNDCLSKGEVDCSDPQWNFSAALLPVRLMTQSSSWWSKVLNGPPDPLPLPPVPGFTSLAHKTHPHLNTPPTPPPGGCIGEGPALDHGGPGAPPGPRLPPHPVPRCPRPPGVRPTPAPVSCWGETG